MNGNVEVLKQQDQQALRVAMKYMGKTAWFTVLIGLLVTVMWVLIPVGVALDVVPLWLGALAMGWLTYMAYSVFHDSVHGSISGRNQSQRWLNNSLGYVMGLILVIPYTAHRYEHLSHHRNTNQPDRDPDYVVANMMKSPFHAVKAALSLVLSQYSYYINNHWATASRKERATFMTEVLMGLLVRGSFLSYGLWFEGVILYGAGVLGGVILLSYLFAYIVHTPHQKVGRYVDTSTIRASGFGGKCLTWAWMFQNYHSIHHLFPKVPFYHYVDIYNEVEGIMVSRGSPIYRLGLRGLVRQEFKTEPQ